MAQIRIKTPQNVLISYELATAFQRFIAFFLDYILLYLFGLLVTFAFGMDQLNERLLVFIWSIIFMFYSLIQESWLKGRTVGKIILGLKVIKLDGTKPRFSDLFLRWIFRPFDVFFSLFSMAIITHTVTENKQRLGDVLAGTTVVSIKFNEKKLSLETIKNNTSLEKYVQKFELIKSFTEEEMVLIKNCLFMKMKYKNKAHQEAFDEMVIRIVNRLELREKPKNPEKFVKTVIKDFVLANR